MKIAAAICLATAWAQEPARESLAPRVTVTEQANAWLVSGTQTTFALRKSDLALDVQVGPARWSAVGKFRPELPGLQYVTTNFWKNPGLSSLFDAEGNLLLQGEPIHTGSPTLPVNWKGDGQELVLLSGNVREGGMVDGQLRRVVVFPDDGHPDLAAAVRDLTGDPGDEVILWDQKGVWI